MSTKGGIMQEDNFPTFEDDEFQQMFQRRFNPVQHMKLSQVSISVDSGTYFVGDPCYVIKDWSQFLDSLKDCIGHSDGHTAIAFTTLYGDGIYSDEDQHGYSVDSGLLGLVPIELAYRQPENLGRIVTFNNKFMAVLDIDYGYIRFGHIKIDIGCEDG